MWVLTNKLIFDLEHLCFFFRAINHYYYLWSITSIEILHANDFWELFKMNSIFKIWKFFMGCVLFFVVQAYNGKCYVLQIDAKTKECLNFCVNPSSHPWTHWYHLILRTHYFYFWMMVLIWPYQRFGLRLRIGIIRQGILEAPESVGIRTETKMCR